MARDIADTVQTQLESPTRTEVLLCFLTVTSPNIAEPARIVCEESGNASIHNGRFLSYVLDGETFVGIPFRPEPLSDNEEVPRATFTIPAYDLQIAEWFQDMEDTGRMKIEYYPSSSWGAPDDDALRQPIGIPLPVYSADHVFIRRASGGSAEVTCEVSGYDLSQEPLGERATPTLTPDLYR